MGFFDSDAEYTSTDLVKRALPFFRFWSADEIAPFHLPLLKHFAANIMRQYS